MNTPSMATELVTYPYLLPCFLNITHSLIFPGTLNKPADLGSPPNGTGIFAETFSQSNMFRRTVEALSKPSVLISPLLPHSFAKLSRPLLWARDLKSLQWIHNGNTNGLCKRQFCLSWQLHCLGRQRWISVAALHLGSLVQSGWVTSAKVSVFPWWAPPGN